MQIAYGDKKEKNSNKPLNGHLKKAGLSPKRFLVEFDIVPGYEYKLGQIFNASIFKQGDFVKVTGTSKGRGFSGVMKRHGFGGGRASHGKNSVMRKAGSVGAGSDPSRIWKGTRMAGRMGSDQVTVKNLQVVKINNDENTIFLCGAVPGAKNSIVYISKV